VDKEIEMEKLKTANVDLARKKVDKEIDMEKLKTANVDLARVNEKLEEQTSSLQKELEECKHVSRPKPSFRKPKRVAQIAALSNFLGRLPIPKAFRILQPSEVKFVEKKHGLIGRGGFGKVELAVYGMQLVAVKTLMGQVRAGPADLMNECQFLALCHIMGYSPRVIGLLGNKQFVMELCGKPRSETLVMGSLRIRLQEPVTLLSAFEKKSEYSDLQVLGFSLEAIQGVQYLHENGLIHCDFKSDNIILKFDSAGNACAMQLIDFGLACLAEDGCVHEESKNAKDKASRMKKHPWMAPELLATPLEQQTIENQQTDVYGVGFLLYELAERLSEDFPDKSAISKLSKRCMAEVCHRISLFAVLGVLKPLWTGAWTEETSNISVKKL
jgi:protein kinase 1